MNPMRCHFCITLWHDSEGEPFTDLAGHLDITGEVTSIIDTARLSKATYVAWGLEDKQRGGGADEDDDEKLHFHVYIELERSERWRTVVNKWQRQFPGAHVEPRKGWRTSAMEYAKGLRNGLPKPEAITSGEWGFWRPDSPDSQPDDLAAEATNLVLHGATPQEVATKFPRWFLRHGGGVIRLWETLNRRKWLR